jgi:S-adenosylmethionine-diacylglycerol 3-amino-3-carboxypropyl transferase
MITWLQRQAFALVHQNRLIYNTCWEDPRLDRQLLGLDETSQVVAITSAGCNVLDYLLDGPGTIHAVDVNFRQNALLGLKLALIRHGDHQALAALFMKGACPAYREIYAAIRDKLPVWVQKFWDVKIRYFRPGGVRRSFYWRTAAGDFAWLFHTLLLNCAEVRQPLHDLLRADSLEEQRRCYHRIEPYLFRRSLTWLLRQPAALAFIGVPPPQLRLIETNGAGGLVGFLKNGLERSFTTIPFKDNYFWRVYLTGSYASDCCPGYLRAENFSSLQDRLQRVTVHTATVTDFLKTHPGAYSHFVLLDHQDWLAWHDPAAILAEWDQIFRNSRPGAKILLRSAGSDLSFLPPAVTARLRWFPEATRMAHRLDRVGTYGSLHLAEVL